MTAQLAGGKTPNDVITGGKRWHGAKVVLRWKCVLKVHHCWRGHTKKEFLFSAAEFRSHIRNRGHENSAVHETTRVTRLCFWPFMYRLWFFGRSPQHSTTEVPNIYFVNLFILQVAWCCNLHHGLLQVTPSSQPARCAHSRWATHHIILGRLPRCQNSLCAHKSFPLLTWMCVQFSAEAVLAKSVCRVQVDVNHYVDNMNSST